MNDTLHTVSIFNFLTPSSLLDYLRYFSDKIRVSKKLGERGGEIIGLLFINIDDQSIII